MELPPYREMPPAVRFRLRQRVLPSLREGTGTRVPYLVAAAIVVAATITLAFFMSPARNAPADQPWTAPTSAADQRMITLCHVGAGEWQGGAYLQLTDGDAVQLGIKDRGILGVCLISYSHPTPSTWYTMEPWQPGHFWPSFQAAVSADLVFGTIGPAVRSVTVDGAPATVANGTFVAEIGMKHSTTVTTLDAQGDVLDRGTVS